MTSERAAGTERREDGPLLTLPIETDCECEGVGCEDCNLGGDWWDE